VAAVVLTPGDPAGIGPEIIVKAFASQPARMRGCVVAGDVELFRRVVRHLTSAGRVTVPVLALEEHDDISSLPPGAVPVLQVAALDAGLAWGQVDARAGRFAATCVSWAAQACARGQFVAMVTAPMHKEALAAAGEPWCRYPGHTELLQAQAGGAPVRMMLANRELRTVLVSIHVALREALDAITIHNVADTVGITHRSLSRVLGRPPRIALAGVNPHAGEGGLFGREELDVLVPVVAHAHSQGWDVQGPYAPDTVFMRARRGEFDVVIAMYHDQGLIPVKYLGVDEGVNVTLGLPWVRTSPDHGTAFDIAGKGLASPSSFLEAVDMARMLSGLSGT